MQNGNLVSDGSVSYAYDVENRLIAGNGASLAYDPLGRLDTVTKNGATTRFLHDGDRIVAEYDGSGSLLRRYVHGDAADQPLVWYEGSGVSSPRYLYADERGLSIARPYGPLPISQVVSAACIAPAGSPGDRVSRTMSCAAA